MKLAEEIRKFMDIDPSIKRMDSMMIESNIKVMGRLELLLYLPFKPCKTGSAETAGSSSLKDLSTTQTLMTGTRLFIIREGHSGERTPSDSDQ